MIALTLLTENPELAVINAERITQGKSPFTKVQQFTTHEWQDRIVENHSTLRAVRFRIYDDNCRSDVARQLARHTTGLIQPYMQSARPDWTGQERPPEPYPVKFILDTDPEGWLALARKRLCKRAMPETTAQVRLIRSAMGDSGIPLFEALYLHSYPPCVITKTCPERKGCGMYPHWRRKLSDSVW